MNEAQPSPNDEHSLDPVDTTPAGEGAAEPRSSAESPGAVDGPAEPTAVDPLQHKLESARHELLDLTLRNRLVNTPRRKSRGSGLEIVDEKSAQVFRILVTEGKSMSFLPRPESKPTEQGAPESSEPSADDDQQRVAEDAGESPLLDQPEEDVDEHGVAARHRDTRLQTGITSEALQRRLLRMFYNARTAQEEQGVNILYLAIGFLKWYESDSSEEQRWAPLILIPVELDRRSARSRFYTRHNGDEISTNLSLQAKLHVDFGVELPDITSDDEFEDVDPARYFEQVRQAISGLSRWEVLDDDMALGFFSFAKLLMYRDLDARNWPDDEGDLLERPLIRSLLSDGFEYAAPLCDDDALIDGLLPAIDTLHVMDADSSQSLAIEEVRRGRNLVIQGPPGTGKSQTIANIIAAAVSEGKRVLFLAEKLAALDVVKRRLTNIGLGDMCLELHSNKARKRAVLEELDRTLKLGPPRVGAVEQTAAMLQQSRDRLNAHASMMHERSEPSGLTPYRVIGQLVRLHDRGFQAADFQLDDAALWTAAEARHRREQLEFLTNHVREIGVPSRHPWRGVMLETSLPSDRARFTQQLPDALAKIDALAQSAEQLAAMLMHVPVHRLGDMARLIGFGRAMAAAPPLDAKALASDLWAQRRDDVTRIVDNGIVYSRKRDALKDVVVEAAWSFDPSQARRDLAATGAAWLRFLMPKFRRAKAALRGILAGPMPKSLEQRLAIFDDLIEARATRSVLESRDEQGRAAFGHMWSGPASDFQALRAIEQWEAQCRDNADVPDGFRALLGRLADRAALGELTERTAEALRACRAALDEIIVTLKLDLALAFDASDDGTQVESLDGTTLDQWRARIEQWRADTEGVARWIGYRLQDAQARSLGLSPLCDRLYDGRIEPDSAGDHFNLAYFEAVIRAMLQQHPDLQLFDGLSHEQILDRFRDLDRRRIELARQQIAAAHYESIPRGGDGIGELGLLRHEIAKKRRHLPIRQLLRRAGNAITRIKPVFMMSPMSIAQYVEPGSMEFDVLVIDEASQVQPVDALGAAARARQIVVVGDDKQLPPTRFFNRVLEEGAIDEEGDGQYVGDLESVLGLCRSQGMADRMLRWHYRSRHHSLIAVSNREFYEDQLYVIPSPTRRGQQSGVVFHHVVDGVYDRAGSRTNRAEARAVAEAVMQHVAQHSILTLGVGAFSVAQRDAIIDELERMRREQPQHESFFASGREEPFFVKNLENIQGDERDVIYISVGYGPDAEGYMTMNFGPLSSEGGERRLNVLITRARQRCAVFSSITDEDIDLSRATGVGPAAFKTYLNYARTGQLGIARPTEREHDSVFEQAVADALAQRGYTVEPQVDEAGFFIDLAVVDPDQPGRYILGIECDGASYHSARSARDRDRIRQDVLEQRGWRIHRIWSTDWFNRPQEQLQKAVDAAERARIEMNEAALDPMSSETPSNGDPLPDRPAGLVREEIVGREDALAQPYKEASFRVPVHIPVHELSVQKLIEVVERIVSVEGPVHGDEVAQRVTTLWGMTRTGSRISRAVSDAVNRAVHLQRVRIVDERFLVPADDCAIVVRDRADVQSSTLRQVEMLPPCEVRRCLELLLDRHAGASRDELVLATRKQLGFGATSSQLRVFIEAQIDALLAGGRIVDDDGRLRSAEPASG